jgi:hypothetical protein
MKTPMQELIEIIKNRQEEEEAMPFMYNEQIIGLAESLLEKEKEIMLQYGNDICCPHHGDENDALYVWNQTFNTKEK